MDSIVYTMCTLYFRFDSILIQLFYFKPSSILHNKSIHQYPQPHHQVIIFTYQITKPNKHRPRYPEEPAQTTDKTRRTPTKNQTNRIPPTQPP